MNGVKIMTKRKALQQKLQARGIDAKSQTQPSELIQKITNILEIKSKKDFVKEFKSCIKNIRSGQVGSHQFKVVSEKELVSLENLFDKYIEILTPATVTLNDFKTLSPCFTQDF